MAFSVLELPEIKQTMVSRDVTLERRGPCFPVTV